MSSVSSYALKKLCILKFVCFYFTFETTLPIKLVLAFNYPPAVNPRVLGLQACTDTPRLFFKVYIHLKLVFHNYIWCTSKEFLDISVESFCEVNIVKHILQYLGTLRL